MVPIHSVVGSITVVAPELYSCCFSCCIQQQYHRDKAKMLSWSKQILTDSKAVCKFSRFCELLFVENIEKQHLNIMVVYID